MLRLQVVASFITERKGELRSFVALYDQIRQGVPNRTTLAAASVSRTQQKPCDGKNAKTILHKTL